MRCYSHLSDAEREQIGLAKAVGHSIGAIAKAIGRPESTVSRELLRNRLPSGSYSPLHAAGAYQLRRRHIPNSIATVRRRLIAAIVSRLPRCPCCAAPIARRMRRQTL
jgi:IS30 family transposase